MRTWEKIGDDKVSQDQETGMGSLGEMNPTASACVAYMGLCAYPDVAQKGLHP